MTTDLLSLVAVYGLPLIFASVFLSCLGVPVPGSLALIAGGAFAASGDLALPLVLTTGLAGAMAGDQTGFGLGRFGGQALDRYAATHPGLAARAAKARAFAERWGGTGVFFSRWLVSPLGPWINLATGAGGFAWGRFALWDLAGEAVWVGLYVGAGLVFGQSIPALMDFLGNLSWFLAALAVAGLLGWRLKAVLTRGGASEEAPAENRGQS